MMWPREQPVDVAPDGCATEQALQHEAQGLFHAIAPSAINDKSEEVCSLLCDPKYAGEHQHGMHNGNIAEGSERQHPGIPQLDCHATVARYTDAYTWSLVREQAVIEIKNLRLGEDVRNGLRKKRLLQGNGRARGWDGEIVGGNG